MLPMRHRLRRLAGRLKSSLLGSALPSAPICLVSDGRDWALDQVAQAMCAALNARRPGVACVAPSAGHFRNRVVHFMSRNLWLGRGSALHPSNRAVVTSLHGVPGDGPGLEREIADFLSSVSRIDRIVTSNTLLRDRLVGWGVKPSTLAVVPLGVDCSLFRPVDPERRRAAKMRFGVPVDRPCIGSFQKDGEGWDEGLVPKLVKGPDIFLDAAARLKERLEFSVLLTGPARGYVRAGLERIGIPYRHHWAEALDEIAECYHALDLYMIASRDEGGPLALLQALATGVPIVATPVGMVTDVVLHGREGMIGLPESSESLASLALPILTHPDIARQLATAGCARARDYDWAFLADACFETVYRPLLAPESAADRMFDS